MKVLNYTTSYFAALLLVIIPIWAAIFYYAMLDEIYDSIDDGLDNQKGLIIKKALVDSSILSKNEFDEGDYAIRKADSVLSLQFRDKYIDTMMYMQNEDDFEPVRLLRTTFKQNNAYYQMDVITSMVEEDDLTTELLKALVWLYIGLVTSILVLNNVLLKRVWKPFYHLLKQLKLFRLEQPGDFATKKTSIEEFRLLNETVDALIRDNIEAYNAQKEFIENAAHELQTPLAISINKLEALAESAQLNAEGEQLLASAMDNLDRLTRLNRSLLLLSRIANKQFAKSEEISVNTIVKKIVEDFSDQIAYKKIEVLTRLYEELTVKMNPDLAMILFTNLIKNAVIHNMHGGKVEIFIDNAALQISNTGKNAPLDRYKIFTRFHNDGAEPESTGLGLAIVKAICDLYHYPVSYTHTEQHTIKITFFKTA